MNRLAALAILAGSILSHAAIAAVVLTPLPGATPQAARPYAGFPNMIGVVATEDGAPVQGLQVSFLYDAFADIDGNGGVDVFTDADGIARVPTPGPVTANLLGTYHPLAIEPGGAFTVFDLTVGGPDAAVVKVLAGDNQASLPNHIFANPFSIQVLGQDGQPLPYAIGIFIPSDDPGAPSGRFFGSPYSPSAYRFVGDANGVVTPPRFIASIATGSGIVRANALNIAPPEQPAQGADIHFIIAAPGSVALSAVDHTTPQTTRLNAFWPNPVGVKATLNGTPAQGVTVTFSWPFDGIADIADASHTLDAITGADGIAYPGSASSPRGYVATGLGTTTITATSVFSNDAVPFSLTAAGKPASRLEAIAGDGQTAAPNQPFAPWIVRAWDDDNHAVPYAAVLFFSNGTGSATSASFEGVPGELMVPADASGVAASPRLIANDVEGQSSGGAQLRFVDFEDEFVPDVPFSYSVSAGYVPGGLREWSTPPRSIPIGGTTAIPFSVRLNDAAGLPLPGMSVLFTADPHCATFAGASTFMATTDSYGIATSLPLTGLHPSTRCAVSANAAGQSVDLSAHVFDLAHVAARASPALVQAQVNSGFAVGVQFTEHGLPVQVSNFTIRRSGTGPVTYATTPVADIYAGAMILEFMANQRPGSYVIELRAGSAPPLKIPVVQTP